jgi:hypothetical protein
MMKKVCLATLLMISAGCATDYKSQSFRGGFSETRLDENLFTVRFVGNAYTAPDRASDFCLLRCAELALANGYPYFIVIDASNYSKESTYTTPVTAHTTGSANTFGTATTHGNQTTYMGMTTGEATTTVYGGQTYVLSKPRSSNTIVCFKEKPSEGGFAFNAAFLVDSLKGKYGIKN